MEADNQTEPSTLTDWPQSGRREGEQAADYVIRVLPSIDEVPAPAWDALVEQAYDPSPFMRHAYLAALEHSGAATPPTGWTPQILTVWSNAQLKAACPLYVKVHSYGEYVFDWAWADAYARWGLPYYPKGLVAVPFTPVSGARLLVRDGADRSMLVQALMTHARTLNLSSLHLLFGHEDDLAACEAQGWIRRHNVQFHWHNRHPLPYLDFDDFLAAFQQEKRKKIRQTRRKVMEAGVSFRWVMTGEATSDEWELLGRCYSQTYLEHGHAPYLNQAFFDEIGRQQPKHGLLVIAQRAGQDMACAFIGLDPDRKIAYGRHWGAISRVDGLHFETCYHQPIEWCILHGYRRFEGGAQGEHKMARALLPSPTASAHWLANPTMHAAVTRHLDRETSAVQAYMSQISLRSPLRQG